MGRHLLQGGKGMIFFLTGVKGGDFGKKFEKRLEKVFHLCVEELNLSNFKGVVHVEMPRKKGLLDERYHGYVEMEDKQMIEGTNYWWAVVRLANTHNFHDVVETFCHEMVHVKQFLRRELTSNGMKWKGQPNPNTDNPFEEPHEVEAYKLEKVLYNKCVDLKLI